MTLFWSIINSDMSDIYLISADISDICRYLSDIGHIWNLGSFTKAFLLQKCSISLICPDIPDMSRYRWYVKNVSIISIRLATPEIRCTDARTWKIWGLLHKKPLRGNNNSFFRGQKRNVNFTPNDHFKWKPLLKIWFFFKIFFRPQKNKNFRWDFF